MAKKGWYASEMNTWSDEKKRKVLEQYGSEGLTENTYKWLKARVKTDDKAATQKKSNTSMKSETKKKEKKRKSTKSLLARPVFKFLDTALYTADQLGLSSHVTNATRDMLAQYHNVPIKVINAGVNYLTSEKPISLKKAYHDADVNPSKVADLFLLYPHTNTEQNYSKAELEAIKDLDNSSGHKSGQITAVGYKKHNANLDKENRYAASISMDSFNDPYKVVEWSVGQTSLRSDEAGNKYLGDSFNFDTKDTRMYISKIKNDKNFRKRPIAWIRALMGLLGSKGYRDNTNSATAILTRIPVTSYQQHGGTINPAKYYKK